MEEKTQKKLDASWKTLSLIGTILAAGFAAATYLGRYQTVDDAKSQHRAIVAEAHEDAASAEERLDAQEEQLVDLRVRNVRIEVGQQQVLDEMRRVRLRDQRARTAAEREAQEQELQEIDERIQRRERALEQSYEQRPILAPEAMSDNDPLADLEGL